jgi:lysophospholipase L1-like esterase
LLTLRRPLPAPVDWRVRVLIVVAVLGAAIGDAAGASLFLPGDFGANSPRTIVAFGDSITSGVSGDGICANPNCIADRPYPAVLQALLQTTHPGLVVLNRGKGGETTDDGLARLSSVLATDRPGFVLIMEGTNDATFQRDPDGIVANLRAMIRLVKASSAIPILGSIVPSFRDRDIPREITAQVNAQLPAVAAAEGARFVNTFGPMNDRDLYGPPDLLHPNQAGYDVLGAAWRLAVENAIAASRPLLEGLTLAVPFDADGDGRMDVAIYRAETGEWLVRRSSDTGLTQVPWGAPILGDRPVPGRYTETGPGARADIAVYRPLTGEWYIRRSTDSGLLLVPWGAPTLRDVPVPGHYDADGLTDVAVYRRTTGEWYIRRSTDAGLLLIPWGAPSLGDVPVPGDYDGDGRTDVAVYRSTTGEWYIRRSTDSGLLLIPWGAPTLGDLPVPGDYDGDNRTDVAVYRRTTGQWFIRRAADGVLVVVPWGAPTLGDLPVPGNYTESGAGARTDVAVYRVTTGQWYLRRTADGALVLVPWGAPSLGDVPVTGAPATP